MKCFCLFLVCLISQPKLNAQQNSYYNTSHIAFTIKEKDLLPENIAFNPNDNSLYVGSTRKGKIIKIAADGSQDVFLASGKYGQWMIIGMKADPERNVLWVCSSGGSNLEGYNLKDEDQGRPAGIFKIELTTGRLINKYTLENSDEVHFFNDLVVAPNGDLFITHMFKQHAIYTIGKDDTLKLFVQSEDLYFPNGICISDDGNWLFVATGKGILKIGVGNKAMSMLEAPEHIKIAGKASLDGLYFYKGSLLGIQPDMATVILLNLEKDLGKILNNRVLESNHPMMDHPTTGTIVGDKFYYIANAQFEKFDKNGNLLPKENLYEVVILEVPLN